MPASRGPCFGHALDPGRVQFGAAIGVDEFAAVDAGGIGQLHHAGIDGTMRRLMP